MGNKTFSKQQEEEFKIYKSEKIRNVAVLGHLGSWKTTLVEACYSVVNGIKASAKASVERKNTITKSREPYK